MIMGFAMYVPSMSKMLMCDWKQWYIRIICHPVVCRYFIYFGFFSCRTCHIKSKILFSRAHQIIHKRSDRMLGIFVSILVQCFVICYWVLRWSKKNFSHRSCTFIAGYLSFYWTDLVWFLLLLLLLSCIT